MQLAEYFITKKLFLMFFILFKYWHGFGKTRKISNREENRHSNFQCTLDELTSRCYISNKGGSYEFGKS